MVFPPIYWTHRGRVAMSHSCQVIVKKRVADAHFSSSRWAFQNCEHYARLQNSEEDRIRRLSIKLVDAGARVQSLAMELRAPISEHIEPLRGDCRGIPWFIIGAPLTNRELSVGNSPRMKVRLPLLCRRSAGEFDRIRAMNQAEKQTLLRSRYIW